MAKQTCAICGAEVNLLQQQKLADGNYICRKECAKRVMKDFDLVHASLYEVQAHIKQLEDGTEIYNKLIKPLNKKKLKWPTKYVVVAEELGLMAYTENRYKIFIFGKYTLACVYRIADLYAYEYEEGTKVVVGNAAAGQKTNEVKTVKYIHYYFWNTAGRADFCSELLNHYDKVAKYFDTLFGIQKTLGNVKETWKNQMSAIKAAGGAAKSLAAGGNDLDEKAKEAADAMERMQYGDRTEWIAKAEAALRNM